jgi:hypothetical protein
MTEYYSKITEHISKITERYIKMAYSKHKMIEYRDNGGLGAAVRGIGALVNTGSTHWSMRDESEPHGSMESTWIGEARTYAGSKARIRSVMHRIGWTDLLVT